MVHSSVCWLSSWRKHFGFTQAHLGRCLGVSKNTISSWETGASSPNLSHLSYLCFMFGIEPDLLVYACVYDSFGNEKPVFGFSPWQFDFDFLLSVNEVV